MANGQYEGKSRDIRIPVEEKEPIGDAKHVRNAVARFNQVEDVSDSERDAAWRRIRAAARSTGWISRFAVGAS